MPAVELRGRARTFRDEARRTGKYFNAASAHAELCGMLTRSSGSKPSAELTADNPSRTVGRQPLPELPGTL